MVTKEPRDLKVGHGAEFKVILGKHLESSQYPQGHLSMAFPYQWPPTGCVCLQHLQLWY